MFKFKTSADRVINRDWKRYVADKDWFIIADTESIAKIFRAYGLEEIKATKTVETNKTNKKTWKSKAKK